MRAFALAALAATLVSATPAEAGKCRLSPKQVVTNFMTKFYIDKKPREAFETWVAPGYIQHNPMAATGRDAAIAFLEPFFQFKPWRRLFDQADHRGRKSRRRPCAWQILGG